MLRLRIILSTLLCVAATLLSGCENDTTPAAGAEPVVELDCYELNVDGLGGDMALFYTIKNPIKREKLQVASNVEWIKHKVTDDYSIVLEVAPSNELEPRHGIVTVDYKHMQRSVKVYVSQDKMVLNAFSFTVEDVTYNSCKVTYTPRDKGVTYMANIIDQLYFEKSGVSTEEEFIRVEMENYMKLATANEMTLEELMQRISPQLIHTDEVVRQFNGMQHSNSYVIYSYGITFSGNEYTQTTPIHHTIVQLPMPSMYKEVSFDISTQMNSTYLADIIVEPISWDGYYTIQIAPDDSLYYIVPGAQPDSFYVKNIANMFFTTARTYMSKGSSAEQFLNSQCYKGEEHLTLQLERGKKYMVIVFAVESEEGAIPVMRSTPIFNYIN